LIQPELALVLDVLIAILLVAVIVYAVRLNRSLSVLQKSKEELEALLAGFTESTEKAERAIQNVKDATNKNKETLTKLLGEADGLREDLSFMIERGNSVADRLDGSITENRGKPQSKAGDTASDIEDAMRAARAAADAPQKRKEATARPLKADPPRGDTPSNVPSLRGATEPAVARPGDDQAADGDEKSKKKSALLRALQGMR